MAFYDLPKKERQVLADEIRADLLNDLKTGKITKHLQYFADEDTYIRKTAYLAIGKLYNAGNAAVKTTIATLETVFKEPEFKIRQTVVNAAGEIGKAEFDIVQHFFDIALFDAHHAVRNAVIGSIKKMGEKNPQPVLAWSK